MSADIPRLITNLKLVRDDSHVMHHPAIEEVIAKLVEMEGDARRYRFLCSLGNSEWNRFGRVPDNEVDAAIDAAINAPDMWGAVVDAAIDAASGER